MENNTVNSIGHVKFQQLQVLYQTFTNTQHKKKII